MERVYHTGRRSGGARAFGDFEPHYNLHRMNEPRTGFGAAMWRRLVVAFLTVLGVATVVFAMVRLLPGDPAETMLARAGAGPEAVAALRSELGLDRPLIVQYVDWLGRVARGDLGRSLLNDRPVGELIAEQWRATAILAGIAFLLRRCSASRSAR